MFRRILVIGATGMLGRPAVNRVTEGGRTVQILTRTGSGLPAHPAARRLRRSEQPHWTTSGAIGNGAR